MKSNMHTTSAGAPLTVSAPAYLDLYDELLRRGYVSDDDTQITRDECLNPEMRIPLASHDALWQLAKQAGAPDNIGLLVGGQVNAEAKGLLSYLIGYSQDVKEALSLYEKHISLMNEGESMQLQSYPWGLRITFLSALESSNTISATERLLSGLLTWGRQLTGQDITPIKVRFSHAQPDYINEYKKAFGCEMLFDEPQSSIDLAIEYLDLKIRSSSEYMKNVMMKQIEQFKRQTLCLDEFTDQVQTIISSNLESGRFTADYVAQELKMSRQSLHRKLKQHDINFRLLLEDIRKQSAVKQLTDNNVSIESIGLKLGFKDASAFYRAFKAWFGVTPGQYRKHLNL
ncbi:AraC family transcriptional regulator ligand-binding domain-containing protein [Pseudomonas sp. HK3]